MLLKFWFLRDNAENNKKILPKELRPRLTRPTPWDIVSTIGSNLDRYIDR